MGATRGLELEHQLSSIVAAAAEWHSQQPSDDDVSLAALRIDDTQRPER